MIPGGADSAPHRGTNGFDDVTNYGRTNSFGVPGIAVSIGGVPGIAVSTGFWPSTGYRGYRQVSGIVRIMGLRGVCHVTG